MAMASLHASLLAPKGGAHPAASAPTLVPRTPTHLSAIGQITPNSGKMREAKKRTAEQKTKKKSLRLSASMDKDLRLLAVRNGLSQQALLELAVSDYLDKAFAASDCVCRR